MTKDTALLHWKFRELYESLLAKGDTEKCPECEGTGVAVEWPGYRAWTEYKECPQCEGTGVVVAIWDH